jgi:hypothetical protein
MDAGCVCDRRLLRFSVFPGCGKYPPGGHAHVLLVKSLGLSPLMRTRQTRHLGDKPLIPQGHPMSGSPRLAGGSAESSAHTAATNSAGW